MNYDETAGFKEIIRAQSAALADAHFNMALLVAESIVRQHAAQETGHIADAHAVIADIRAMARP